jgi:hypothetical protein
MERKLTWLVGSIPIGKKSQCEDNASKTEAQEVVFGDEQRWGGRSAEADAFVGLFLSRNLCSIEMDNRVYR